LGVWENGSEYWQENNKKKENHQAGKHPEKNCQTSPREH
jgi:hypothetical protein